MKPRHASLADCAPISDKPHTERAMRVAVTRMQRGKTTAAQFANQQAFDRALAALKEAIGLDPACCLQVPDERLPEPTLQICCAEVVNLALRQRAELVQAGESNWRVRKLKVELPANWRVPFPR